MSYIFKNKKIYNTDIFAFSNTLLFLFMCIVVYFDRFVKYRGAANIHEFFFYAFVIFLVIFLSWVKFRTFRVKSYILVAIQITILIHFAGAFIQLDDHRLYDLRFFDIRYDKFVHYTNSLLGAFIIHYLFKKKNIDIGRITLAFVGFIVLGIGALIEILEFIVVLSIPHNGVGDYINNMSDLISNLLGVSTYALINYKKQAKHEKQ
ncbi:MAG: hypothetical protein CR967_04370 [Proteobacteria bacterium]|nr:MAG: hypothetical protein CR967_04370 [Pseudomonadota bacterium]